MRRFWVLTIALAGALAVALVATLPTPIGFSPWHYNASFLVALVATGLAWRPLQHRRIATLSMAASGIVATASGFAMLYTKDFPRKEWIMWWHSFTSFVLMLAFLIHWLHNNTRLWDFTKRLWVRERTPGYAAAGAWIAIAGVGAWSWLTGARSVFTSANYQYLASWAVLGGVVFAYGIWLAYRLPSMRARLAVTAHRNRARALVDTSLFLAHWGALLTGFALLYFYEPLRAGPLKYVSKWWHTATSVAFLAFLALHIGFNARLLAAHARRVDDELAAKP